MPSLKCPLLPIFELSIASAITSSSLLSWAIHKVNVVISQKIVDKSRRRKIFSPCYKQCHQHFQPYVEMKKGDIFFESQIQNLINHSDTLPWHWYDHYWYHLGCQAVPYYAFETDLHLLLIKGNSLVKKVTSPSDNW